MIIDRPKDIERLKGTAKWTLLFGRRKTGKSFLVENYTTYDEFFYVKTDRGITSKKGNRSVAYEAFLALLKHLLSEGKTVVVDEFHRLGEDFFDELHAVGRGGRLILVSSTLHMAKKLIGAHSALLGLVAEVPLGLISMEDCLRAIGKTGIGKKEKVELALLLREPIVSNYSLEAKPPREQFASALQGSMKTVPALVGEIFAEEERTASATYGGILRAVANGKVVSGEISSFLFARKLVRKDDPSLVQPYLKNLIEFGILRRVEVLGKNKFIYKHVSPLCRLFYYADEKYNISERNAAKEEVLRIVDGLLPRMVEDEIRSLAAEKYGLSEAVMEGKDFDVDACLMKFRKVEIAMEVKWKGRIGADDIRKAEESLGKIDAKEKWLFVPDKKMVGIKTSLKVIDIDDLA